MLTLRLLLVLGATYVAAALALFLMTGHRMYLRHLSQATLILLLVLALMGLGYLVTRWLAPLF